MENNYVGNAYNKGSEVEPMACVLHIPGTCIKDLCGFNIGVCGGNACIANLGACIGEACGLNFGVCMLRGCFGKME